MELEKRINAAYSSFNEVDDYIAKAIVNNKAKCEQYTIKQFAQNIHVSQSALTRFAKKIGLQGYKEIKSMIRIEKMEKANVKVNYQKDLIDNYHQVIQLIQNQNNDALFEKIYQAKRILIFADGFAMSKVASECKRMFLPLNKKVFYIHGFDMIHSFVSLAQADDIAFIFSFVGDSVELIELAKHLDVKGCSLVSITKMGTNGLAQVCKHNLYVITYDFHDDAQLQLQPCTSFYLLLELFIIQYQFYCEHNFKK